MMSLFKNLATPSYLFFVVSIVLGILLPQAASVTFYLILPALMMILTLTLLRFPRGFFSNPRALLPGALLGNLMNYLILGNLIILLSIFLIRDEKLWIGMILIAAVPSAVAILPLTEKIGADRMLTYSGFAGTYLAGIILTPLIGVAFLKYIPISYPKLIVLVLALIGLPVVFSRILVDRNWDIYVTPKSGLITNSSFFILYYTLAARNTDVIKKWPIEILLIAAVAVLSVLLVSLGFYFFRKIYKFNDQNLRSLLLLGSMKNYGLAGGIALYVFQNESALPALICSIVMFAYVTVLKFIAPQKSDQPV